MSAAAQPRTKRYARVSAAVDNQTKHINWWTWTVYTRNGRVVATNGGFDTKAGAIKAVRREYGADITIKEVE